MTNHATTTTATIPGIKRADVAAKQLATGMICQKGTNGH